MPNDIPIIQKVYDFYKNFCQVSQHMPKFERYILAAKIEEITLELLKDLFAAGRHPKTHKLEFLSQAAVKVDLLKTLLRLAEETKSITTKKYLELSENLQEIGKMLGGWIRSLS